MTKDEYQVQVSLGLVNRKILNHTTDTELLKAVVDYTVPDQERRLDLGWLDLCIVSRNVNTPLEVLLYMWVRPEIYNHGMLREELDKSITRWHRLLVGEEI